MHFRPRVVTAVCAAVVPLVLASTAIAIASPGHRDPNVSRAGLVVATTAGSLKGESVGKSQQFLGVPYAAPPVRDLRFAAPKDPDHWSGVRAATRKAPACLQFAPSGVREEQAVSEDCLYLDLYRPSTVKHRSKAPVIVFVHGGGSTQGTGVIYGGRSMAEKTGAIVVSINYRLGALGYLAHPALSAETPGGSGNYGLMDQIQALKWVSANIRNFGGDPNNVTLQGQSSGAGSVCNILASPAAAGLVDKAIIESTSCMGSTRTLASAEPTGVAFANAVGCTDAATVTSCLRKVWPGTLVANAALAAGGPKVGGAIVPEQLSAAIADGTWNAVPILTGSTKSERRLQDTSLAGITAQGYEDMVRSSYGARADQVLAMYPLADYKSPYDAITQVRSDAGNVCGVERHTRVFNAKVPTYRYEFNDPTSPTLYGFRVPGEDMSNGHSGELAYLFDFTLVEKPLVGDQLKLQDQMMRYWATFARTGNPSYKGAPAWPTYGDAQNVMELGQGGKSHVINTLDQDHNCAFWLS